MLSARKPPVAPRRDGIDAWLLAIGAVMFGPCLLALSFFVARLTP